MARALQGNELHPVYARYRAIYNRCFVPKHPSYKSYGERGITLHNELMPFVNFRDYVTSLESYSEQALDVLTLDRIDNNKGYEKGNLRWVDRSTQTANQRYSGKGRNKYTGVNYSKTHGRWIARVSFKGKTLLSSTHMTEEEALNARNLFILANKLPHPVQQFNKV